MKKNFIFLMLMISGLAFSQCFIQGNATMKVSETANYSVDNETAQCKDCHFWEVAGDVVSLEGNNKQNSIKVKPKTDGTFILSVSVLTPKGMKQCSKNIQIVNDAAPENPSNSPNCDINFKDFKELKYSDGVVVFLPADVDNSNKFEWAVNYADGTQKTSQSKTPQFNYSKENGIVTVVAKISSAKCVRNFTKTYHESFWKFF